jgi:outer membrane receptor protein involved in Fe transport
MTTTRNLGHARGLSDQAAAVAFRAIGMLAAAGTPIDDEQLASAAHLGEIAARAAAARAAAAKQVAASATAVDPVTALRTGQVLPGAFPVAAAATDHARRRAAAAKAQQAADLIDIGIAPRTPNADDIAATSDRIRSSLREERRRRGTGS